MLSKDRLIAEIRDNPYIKEYKRLEKTNEDATLKRNYSPSAIATRNG